MQELSFGKEWNQRAGFVGAIAVINPIILLLYVMFVHRGAGALEFWLVGLGLTFIVCLIAGTFMLMVILTDRRKRERALRKQAMWEGVMPYDPKQKATSADKATSEAS